jgi:hypothetical protein
MSACLHFASNKPNLNSILASAVRLRAPIAAVGLERRFLLHPATRVDVNLERADWVQLRKMAKPRTPEFSAFPRPREVRSEIAARDEAIRPGY